MSDEEKQSISVRFLNEALAERGSQLVVKAVPVGRVLLVEDDVNDAVIAARLFSAIGLELIHAPDGLVALDLIKNQQFSLVLLDLKLPGMSGLDLLQILRRKYPELHVIILAGALTPELTERAVGLGYIGFVIKPITRGILLDLLLQNNLVRIGFP
jgi:CheY-like chemotaxis protein